MVPSSAARWSQAPVLPLCPIVGGISSLRVDLGKLNIDTWAALCEALPSNKMWRVLKRLGFYFIVLHGSWLNLPNWRSRCSAANGSASASRIATRSAPRSPPEKRPATNCQPPSQKFRPPTRHAPRINASEPGGTSCRLSGVDDDPPSCAHVSEDDPETVDEQLRSGGRWVAE